MGGAESPFAIGESTAVMAASSVLADCACTSDCRSFRASMADASSGERNGNCGGDIGVSPAVAEPGVPAGAPELAS